MKNRFDVDTKQLAIDLIDARLVNHLVCSLNKVAGALGKRLKLVDNK